MATMNRDRGQLLLIGALALAISLVAIALVLNSAVYTHNLASRADSPGDGATTVTRDVRYGTGGLMDYSNEEFAGQDYSTTVLDNYTTGVPDIETAIARDAAADGRIVRASHDTGSDHEGVRIVDAEASGSMFYPASGPLDKWWVTNDTHVRGFELAVQRSSLADLDTSSVESALATGDLLTVTAPFTVAFDDGSNEWRVAIYDDTVATDTVSVTVRNVGANTNRTCSVDAAEVRVEFADHRVEGEQCAALSFFDELSGTSDVVYYYGGSAVGQYELVADVPVDGPTTEVGPFTDAVDTANYGNHCAGPTYNASGSPYPRISPAIYAANVSTTFTGTDVTFNGTQRVAPDELGPEPVAPRILAFDVSETDATTGGEDTYEVTWATDDPNGDAVSVDIVINPASEPQVSFNRGASGTESFSAPGDFTDDTQYEISITASAGSNSRTVTQTHEDNGGNVGCPE